MNTGVAYVFASLPPTSCLPRFAPMRRRLPLGLVPLLSRGTTGYRKWVAHRDSQVPVESFPYLCPALRFRPVRQTSPRRSNRCGPRQSDSEDTSDAYFGTQSRGFSTRCLRFKSCVTARTCKARFRLVVSLYREGVEPSGFHRKVSVLYIGLPPLPGLSWRYVEKLLSEI